MKLFASQSGRNESIPPDFDDLRARLESDVIRPSVIAMTAASASDEAGVVACGLARSLAAAGYATLFIGTARKDDAAAVGVTLDQVAHSATPDATVAGPVVVSAGDQRRQRHLSRRTIQLAFETLRRKFDYIVVEAQYENASPFAMSVIGAADAVVVSVMTGRRERRADAKLSAALGRSNVNFLGILAFDSKAIASAAAATTDAVNGSVRWKRASGDSGVVPRHEVADALLR